MTSIYFEDFTVGRVFDLGSVTVTEAAIVDFATQFDPQPFHVDPVAAQDSSFGGLIASGWHTGSLWMRLYADALLLDAASRGSPGVEAVRWLAPVRPGDTLHATTEVVDVQPSTKDLTRGTVFTRSTMTNQDGVVVMTMTARGLFGRRTRDTAAAALADPSIALIAAARRHVANSAAPYSKFRAGAAVRTGAGNLHAGVIVENVSLGLSMCAERVAMFAAVAAGERPVQLALAAPATDGALTWPCGACVQVALELGGRDLLVVVGDVDDGPTESATVADLLPRGPKVDRN